MLGGSAGGVHLVNLETGELLASPKMEDHDGPVTGLSAHMTLRHFISSGSDGMIKASYLAPYDHDSPDTTACNDPEVMGCCGLHADTAFTWHAYNVWRSLPGW